jgi:hypothetical protein
MGSLGRLRRNRRGRKRKSGQRYPSGQPKRQAETPRKVAETMPHRRELGEAAASHLAYNAIGRLLLRGRITPEMHNAACMFQSRVLAWQSIIEGPQQLTRGNGCAYSCNGCVEYEVGYCHCAARKLAYLELFTLLKGPELKALYYIVLLDEEPYDISFSLLTSGLKKLVIAWGLTNDRKSYSRNAQSRIPLAACPNPARPKGDE